MHNLTANITVLNVGKMEVVRVDIDSDASVAYVHVKVHGTGANPPRYPAKGHKYELAMANGICQGLRAKGTPEGYDDVIESFSKTVATGFTDVVAQYRTGASDAAGRRNVEIWMASAPVALIPAGT